MRVFMMLGAMLLALATVGCGDSNNGGGGGGSGGGGTGGDVNEGGDGGGGTGGNGPEERRQACRSYCEPLVACGFETDEADCLDECRWSLPTNEFYETCGACLGETACDQIAAGACDEACSMPTSDLVIKSEGFSAHAGKRFHLFVSRILDNRIMATMSYVLDGSEVERTYKNVLIENVSYRVEYWIDTETDGRCNAMDVAGMHTWEDVSGHQTYVMDASAKTDTAACTRFSTVPVDLTLKGTDVSAWAGKTLWFEATHPVAEDDPPMIPLVGSIDIVGNSFEKTFPNALNQRQGYTLNYLVDMDEDGACSAADYIGSVKFTSSGHIVKELSPADDAPAGGRDALNWVEGNITFHGTDLGEYEGRLVRILLSRGTGQNESLAGWGKGTITGGEVKVTFENASQADGNVYWYIDVDGSKACSNGDKGGKYRAQPQTGHATVALPAPDQNVKCTEMPFPGLDATLTGTGFNKADRQTAFMILVDAASGNPLVYNIDVVENGSFETMLRGRLTPGTAYEVYGYLDLDGDDLCTPGKDPSWKATVTPTEDFVFEVSPTSADADACRQLNSYFGVNE